MEREEFDIQASTGIVFLNGQQYLHDTEEALYRYLIKKGHYSLVIDDLFNYPKRLQSLKYLNIDTIIVGTTGTYRDKIDKVFSAFKKLKWMPKNVIFTMGEEYFDELLNSDVRCYKLYPYYTHFDFPPQIHLIDTHY